MVVAPSITWLLVSISPDDVSTMPVPAACSLWYPRVVLMSTKPGSTLAAMAETSPGPAPPELPELPEEPDPDDPDPPPKPEPGEKGVELEEGGAEVAELTGVLPFHAAWLMPAPAATAMTMAPVTAATLRKRWDPGFPVPVPAPATAGGPQVGGS